MKFLIMPIAMSVVGAGIWAILYMNGFNSLIAGDHEAMASGAIAFLAIAHSLFANFMFATLLPQWRGIREAVETKDRTKFNIHRRKELPETMRGLMILLSLLLVTAFYLLSFEHLLTGIFTIFSVVMIVTIYWVVIADLDAFRGFWSVQNIPEEWLKDT